MPVIQYQGVSIFVCDQRYFSIEKIWSTWLKKRIPRWLNFISHVLVGSMMSYCDQLSFGIQLAKLIALHYDGVEEQKVVMVTQEKPSHIPVLEQVATHSKWGESPHRGSEVRGTDQSRALRLRESTQKVENSMSFSGLQQTTNTRN